MSMTKYGAVPEETSKTASGNPGKYQVPDTTVKVKLGPQRPQTDLEAIKKKK